MAVENSLNLVQRTEFLRSCGWATALEIPVSGDWSQRKFFRLDRSDKTAILIHSFPDDDPRTSPGHRLKDFVKISKYLNAINLSAPRIIAQDIPHGLLLVEDFGSQDFTSLINMNVSMERDLYMLATSALKFLYARTRTVDIELPDYFKSHIHKGHQRVVDWYMPAMLQRVNTDNILSEYLNIWASIEKNLPPCPRRFVHGDFHPGNLMWLPVRQDSKQVGILDFQQGMVGPAPYDLVNLLEDARREVPVELRRECLAYYVDGMKKEDMEAVLAWYPVLAAQFHFRVIGQAIRLAIRDKKTRLMDIVPILRRHIVRDLASPILKPFKEWFDVQGIDFNDTSAIDLRKTVSFIRSDAN